MQKSHLLLSIIGTVLLVATAQAQFKEGGPAPGGTELGEAKPGRWKIGITITAVGGPCSGVVGYVPIPMDWPEQEVRVVEEDVSPSAKTSEKTIDGTVRVMVVKIGRLRTGETAKALVTYEVTHRPQLPPETTDQYVMPDTRKMRRDVRRYLGASPKIECKDPKIRRLADEIVPDKPRSSGEKDTDSESSQEDTDEASPSAAGQPTAWERVEAIYDWVREHVTYKRGPQKSALETLKDRTADCEGMTALFIALCRAKGVPARTVWVQGHCYPEFYLEDRQGKGHWFPCQVAGDRAMGGIPETKPIFQKGDNFRSLGNSRDRVHYLSTLVTGNRMAGSPRFRETCEAVDTPK